MPDKNLITVELLDDDASEKTAESPLVKKLIEEYTK